MPVNYKGLNCIVTGGAGFIGQNLVRALIGLGAHVYVIDNFSYGAKRSNIHTNAHIFEGDIATYKSFTSLPDIEYAYVFHFAGPSSIVHFTKTPEICINETVLGMQHAIDFCSKKSIKLIYPSSGSVYAGTRPPQKETSQINTNTLNIYAKTKLHLEQLQRENTARCTILALRIFAGYGPSEKHKDDAASVIYSFCKMIHNKKQPILYGNGQQVRDFIYISDIVDAIITLAANCSEPVVNIGSRTSISFKELITIINSITGATIEPIYMQKPDHYLEKTLADTSRLKKYFNQPLISIEKGIRSVIQSL